MMKIGGQVSRTIVECVPNFSEGRDPSKLDAIIAAIRSAGAAVLDLHMDADHNRSVVTFAGAADVIGEAAVRAVEQAVALIDLNGHRGVHPRIGAADVVPFVPVEGVTMADCAAIAACAGEEVWRRTGVPVYLYEAAARRPDRINLADIRKGQFEGLREAVRSHPDLLPDFGNAELHPTAGATVIGARKFLIAYNINLATSDVSVARRIARKIRFSSGGLPAVKAIGVLLSSRNIAQVSMNLVDFEQSPMHRVFEAVRAEAEREGVTIAGSEVIGLVPNRAFEMAAESYLQIASAASSVILENRLATAMPPAPSDHVPDALAAAAATAAIAAALGSKVDKSLEADRRFFEMGISDPVQFLARAGDVELRLQNRTERASGKLHSELEAAQALIHAALAAAQAARKR